MCNARVAGFAARNAYICIFSARILTMGPRGNIFSDVLMSLLERYVVYSSSFLRSFFSILYIDDAGNNCMLLNFILSRLIAQLVTRAQFKLR